jgi:hypothetical protein
MLGGGHGRGGAAACRREGKPGHSEVQGGAREIHRIKAVMMHAREGRKRGRRGGVHGAGLSGELDRGSGERFPWMVVLPRRANASTECARWRRCSEQDGGAGGELWWPEWPTSARRFVRAVASACACSAVVGAVGGNGREQGRRTRARRE